MAPDAPGLNELKRRYHELYRQGRYQEALPLARQAYELTRRRHGPTDAAVATAANNLASMHVAAGELAEAESLYQEALSIKRTVYGDESETVAVSLNNLASLYQAMGDLAAAERCGSQALMMRRRLLHGRHPDLAISLSNYATLCYAMGRFAEAERLCRESAEIWIAIGGDRHANLAPVYNTQATLHWALGNFTEAERLFLRSLDIMAQHQGRDHPDYASLLSNLAVMYEETGRWSDAERQFLEALEIDRRTLGPQHPGYAIHLNNLAMLYHSRGRHDDAEQRYREARQIHREALGDRHSLVAGSTHNLAELYRAQGRFAEAEPLHREACSIFASTLGEDHPELAIALNNLASLYAATGRAGEALATMERSARIIDAMIGQVFSVGSETQRMAYLDKAQMSYFLYLSLVLRHHADSPAAVQGALDLVLRRKAVAAEALAAQRDGVLGGRYPALEGTLRELTALRMRIAQKALAGPGPEGLAAYQRQLQEWKVRKEHVERELAQHIPEMSLQEKLRAADRQGVARALPPGAALVEFVRFEVYDFHAVPARFVPAHYVAFVLAAGEPDRVELIDLGAAERIDRAIAAFREGVTRERDGGTAREGAAPAGAGAAPSESRPAPAAAQALALRAMLLDPLASSIAGRQRLLLAPDGDLARLPFEALPATDGRRVIDEHRVSYLSVGRDVLRFGDRTGGGAGAPLVLADPDFDLGATTGAARPDADGGAGTAEGRRSRSFGRGAPEFGRLPGTRVEGERIAGMLGVEPWVEAGALESRLKGCRSPRILHVATHGFFLADQERTERDLLRAARVLGESGGRMAGPGIENPLLRSGLALAGANTWLQGGSPPPDAEDGVLTAEDVSGLDLLDTELVVLSACETGLGTIRTGEGVFGLRRAFVLAGARTLVMSLWKVPDLATAILMDRFYENLVRRGRPRDEALRDAQFYTRDLTVGEIRQRWLSAETLERLAGGSLAARFQLEQLAGQPDDRRPFEDPLYWGGFICQGETAALGPERPPPSGRPPA